jgi:Zn-dependent protease
MFRRALRLPFKLLGIPVSLDTSFLLVLPLFAYLIGSQIPAYVALFRRAGLTIEAAPLTAGLTPYLLGLIGALGLFLSVLVHELGHAVVARLYGVEVREITLWFLGGVAQFTDMPRQRGAEAVVAIVGPITSGLIALLTGLAWQLAVGHDEALFVLSYLTVTNAGLALFNLLPALPLDGGRVLRSLLALVTPHLRATRIAGAISSLIAVLLGVYGFFSLNLFLVVIAFFVYNAGRAETRAAIVNDAFEGYRVRDLMTAEALTVEPGMALTQFQQLIYYRRHSGYPVVDAAGRLLGFARLQDARGGGPNAVVEQIMLPAETIGPDEPAREALRRLGESSIGRLAVVDPSGRLVGVLSKTDLIRRLREHGEGPVRPGGGEDGTDSGLGRGFGGGPGRWPG